VEAGLSGLPVAGHADAIVSAHASGRTSGWTRWMTDNVTVASRLLVCCAVLVCCTAGVAVAAERIENQVAVFSALDKVTARISTLEVPLGETKTFGALKVTPRACYSRPATEQPKTTSFVEVEELQLDGQQRRIFTGWMFAESPGLNAVEHPVFDVWLTQCQKPAKSVAIKEPPADGQQPAVADGPEPGAGEEQPEAPRRRVRR
jgi:hypothetical protein